VPAATLTDRAPVRPFRSKRLLALAGDERLVEQIRRGNELAFEVAFERHGAGILGFCRHMLGSREEAEDAVQHTFAAAFHDLQRGGDRSISLRAWLYTIARNRCVSMLRARREQAAELDELPTDGLSDEVERRAELRELLADVRELPEDQRAALLLAEAGGLSHAEVAQVLGCEVPAVKGLVFRARSGLIERRAARETSCEEIREQLATLRGGALRRNELRHHLRRCPGCSAYREDVRRQRQLLSAALPVVPTFALKSGVLSAAGISSGAALGGAGLAGASAGGAALSSAVGKVALVGVLAGSGAVVGGVAMDRVSDRAPAGLAPAASQSREHRAAPAGSHGDPAVETRGAHGERISGERSHGRRGAEQRSERANGKAWAGSKPKRDRTSAAGGRKRGHEKRAERTAGEPRGNAHGRNGTAKGQTKQRASKPQASRPSAQAPAAGKPAAQQTAPQTPVLEKPSTQGGSLRSATSTPAPSATPALPPGLAKQAK
jgi:RNA polymerase sigma factor (sigma-70 family)